MEALVKRITVRDLAKELNLSLGAINKALNNKPGLRDDTRDRILKTAERMGYQVNRVAQSLARNPIKIGIIMPDVWPEYCGFLRHGINQELNKLRDYNVIGKYYSVPGLHASREMVEALKNCENDGMNAVIILPNHDTDYEEYVDILYNKGMTVIALGSDFTYCKRSCCVMVNAHGSGRLAAEYMKWLIEKGKSIAVFIGNKDFKDHKEKVEGFLKEAGDNSCKITGVFETNDEPEIAYHIAGKLINDISNLGGIYIATGNSIAVCKYITEHNIENIHLIGTDLFTDIVKYVKSDVMQGVIFQDTITQGKIAIQVVYDYLVNSKDIQGNIFIKPQLILKSNIDEYYNENQVII